VNLAPYLAVIATRFKALLQYRAVALAGFTTQLFWGFIRVMVFVAFFDSVSGPVPMTFSEVLVYIWLGQALYAMLPWSVDGDIATEIRTGAVAYDLLRPLNLYGYWFARTLAFRSAGPVLRMLPMLAFTFLILPIVGLDEWALPLPASGVSGVLFVVAVVGTLFLSTAFTTILHISLMWTISGEGFNRMMPGLVPVLAGVIVPLPLFPDWLQPYLYWQPFRSMADVPYRIYSGHIPVDAALFEIGLQWLWFVAIVGSGLWLLTRARRKLVIQGG
jgi:ABC-2 type transport system permease protein